MNTTLFFHVLAITGLVLAAIPAFLFVVNLRAYRPPPWPRPGTWPEISVLIPARDEEASIAAAVEAALASVDVTLEVVVLDDHSRDATAAIVSRMAAVDPRVRLISGPPLPPSWCGKQHACAVLGECAAFPLLAFIDADVRLAPDGLARLAAFLKASGADLVSGIPRQETGTFAERLVIPLIHFILLGFLPIDRARRDGRPGLAAGCGQLFLARRSAYEQAGGHAAIRSTFHDGLKLPRAFRAAGLRTDLCDLTGVASCRMYHGARSLWHGLAKNAGEALAAPGLIGPATVILFGGQVLPILVVGLALGARLNSNPTTIGVATVAAVLSSLPRWLAIRRFRQSIVGALLHPLSVLVLLAIQWYALTRNLIGRPATWKGRPYQGRPLAAPAAVKTTASSRTT